MKTSTFVRILFVFVCLVLYTCQHTLFAQATYDSKLLEVWRTRAAQGPYKSLSDFQANSPADFDRIRANAANFKLAPSKFRWKPYPTTVGCVPGSSEYESRDQGLNIRDAAYYYLITQDASYAPLIRAELVAQANEPLTNWANTARWCPDVIKDLSPGYFYAAAMIRYMLAYDYTRGYSGYTTLERTKILQWFQDAGTYFLGNVDGSMNQLFVNRPAGNYTLSSYALARHLDENSTERTYYGGPLIPNISRSFNNRRVLMITCAGIAGVMTNNTTLKNGAIQFVKDFYKYGEFPNGVLAELERSSESDPEKGFHYGLGIVHHITQFADALARSGDAIVYTYTTSEGILGTAGGSKGLFQMIDGMTSLMDGTVMAYATLDPAKVGNAAYRIDGYDPNGANGKETVADAALAQANMYYQSTLIDARIRRIRAGMKGYARYPAGEGNLSGWTGGFGTIPASLFQYGGIALSPANFFRVIPQTRFAVTALSSGSTLVTDSLQTVYLGYRPSNALQPGPGTQTIANRTVLGPNSQSKTLTVTRIDTVMMDSVYVETGVGIGAYLPDQSFSVEHYWNGTWVTDTTITNNTKRIVAWKMVVPKQAAGFRYKNLSPSSLPVDDPRRYVRIIRFCVFGYKP